MMMAAATLKRGMAFHRVFERQNVVMSEGE
jgi:hypothetical protein